MKTFFTRNTIATLTQLQFKKSTLVVIAKRVLLNDVLIFLLLGIVPASAQTASHPPISIPFHLNTAGYVSLVVEDTSGYRIRNLVSETWFEAGSDTAWWDGTDDLGRNIDASNHGVYQIPSQLIKPGNYTVRGLVRGKISPKYEFSPYNTGYPPWPTADHVGGWLANHTAPQAAVFVPANQSPSGQPAVILGCYITEGPDGVAWVDLDGNKLGGKSWVGGNWTAAPYMARDAGNKAITSYKSYVASVWTNDVDATVTELRVNAFTAGIDQKVITYGLGATVTGVASADQIGGLAVNNGIIVVSLPYKNQLVFINARLGTVIGTTSLVAAKGLAFDACGYLLALTQGNMVRYNTLLTTTNISSLPAPQTIIQNLLDPIAITLDSNKNFYVSDRGTSHQVKVFNSAGVFVRNIGNAGVPQAGPYDSLHMNNPAGITIDSRQQLWVTENDFLPKRVSVWKLDGTFIKAFYGPAKYGGGGTIDSQDKTKFYYSETTIGAMEFTLDWTTGKDKLKTVIFRPQVGDMDLGFRGYAPENAFYHNGTRYFSNCYNTNPTNGHPIGFLFIERGGVAKPVAAMGLASYLSILLTPSFKTGWPAGIDLTSTDNTKQALFIWNDLNADAQIQPNEVSYLKGYANGVTVMPDLSFCIARVGTKTLQFVPISYNAQGTPIYDVNQGITMADSVLSAISDGGNQALASPEGWSVIGMGMKPYTSYSLSGTLNGKAKWSYPSMWPGLHPSHMAPKPSVLGELIGTTRLLGGYVRVPGSDVGKIWAINGNMGNIYLFTSDGIFVATMFEDVRNGLRWTSFGNPTRNMSLDGLTLQDENFWPTITQTPDSLIYIVDGGRSAILRLDGINNMQRIAPFAKTVTAQDLQASEDYQQQTEQARQAALGIKSLTVPVTGTLPVVDGVLTDWDTAAAAWSPIDTSGVSAWFNASSKPYNVKGSIKVAGSRLYVAYQVGDNALLNNSGQMLIAPFKTGGALDLMIGVNPLADTARTDPVEGDMRLLVTIVNAKTYALLYRAVVSGTLPQDKIPFSSPWRTITFDKVDDVSSQVELAGVNGNYEISIPLATLGLTVQNGMAIKGDIGILRGDGSTTTSRTYWSNKATSITADVPSEAALTPALWGKFNFVGNTPMPVSLLSFSGQKQAGGVALNWNTASEFNNSRFNVLRSNDAHLFQQIGTVAGSGTSTMPKSYRFLDEHPYVGTNFYQLSQVDYDGTSTKSSVVSVTTTSSESNVSMVIKNQVLKLVANSVEAKDFNLLLTDMSGKVLGRFSNKLVKGNNLLNFNVGFMASGIYLVTFSSNVENITTKIFVE